VDEKRFLVAAVAEDIPILGVCLGCQLLADALGGEAYLAATPEVEIGPLLATAQDPVVDVLTNGPTFTIHRDTWDIPPGGTLVARSRMYNQAFRFGSALGVQPHPEADASIVEAWLSHERGSAVVGAAGGDPDAVLADFHAVAEEVSRLADEFFGAWLEEAETASMSRTS
jgi:GMP synthase (glutamine-hydrolysing)